MKYFKIKINGKEVKVKQGQTVLEVARENGINIPALCYHPDLKIKANCRLCIVEIKGKKGVHTSCSTHVEPDMEIITDSDVIKGIRKTNLELIASEHKEECGDCIKQFDCTILKLSKECDVELNRFEDRKKNKKSLKFGPSVEFDASKCIDCRNCIEVCNKQSVGFFELQEKNGMKEVVPTKDKDHDCIYCGQCILHCPVGAIEAMGEFKEVEEPLQQKDKTVVFQFAPSIRTSIGEEFGMDYGEVVTDHIVGAIKALGVKHVFDTSVGADFTTYEEAKEYVEKLESGCLPCISSCCPSWVKFIEFNYPEFIPHIATTRSPQIILGGLIKTYWAEKMKIDPKNIVVVSVMPCTAKKYEIRRKENKVRGMNPVDQVLTTRELAFLLKHHKIDLKKIKPVSADNPLGVSSGAGVIYGASGGVAESVLRTACSLAGNKNPKIDFEEVRGMEEIKVAKVNICGKSVKMAVINGIGAARRVLEEMKKDPCKYDGLEVMACPGGCVGGGGQPIPTTAEIRKKRAESLYSIDKKKKLRTAHENPIVKEIYEKYLTDEKKIKEVCHTSYRKKKREVKI
ncbi:[FeFe] hydrogenase, group A [Patescibacteria group bacterium]|nr:[FeFe] hydrogenase, group A [Patescibacteria group bacterium]